MAQNISQAFIKKLKIERILGLLALLILIVASILGYQRSAGNNDDKIVCLLSEHQFTKLNDNNIYEVYSTETPNLCGYIHFGEEIGYGGPLEVAVLLDTSLSIKNLTISSHKETPSYVDKVFDQKFHKQIIGKDYTSDLNISSDLDGISGATYTSVAIAEASKRASQTIASKQIGYIIPIAVSPSIEFGLPEILLILMFALSMFGIYSNIKWKKTLRWSIMIISLLIFGFWLSIPLSLFKFNTFLLGYFPQWYNNLYWYILIGGTILTLLITNKRVYCNWICPFGTVQNCLGVIGKTENKIKGKIKIIVQWTQRILALSAIAAALYFRNPGSFNYEIFGTFFTLTGTTILFIITGIYVISSMFTTNPYCHTLCPIEPISDFLIMIKRWVNSAKNKLLIKNNKI